MLEKDKIRYEKSSLEFETLIIVVYSSCVYRYIMPVGTKYIYFYKFV